MVSDRLEHDLSCRKRRWVAYFDLLGTRQLIHSNDHVRVFGVYAKAIEQATKRSAAQARIHQAWFSDTFLTYSESDSGSDFVAMDMVARWFVYFLILDEIPVRGAIACGDFYADRNNHLYFGEALIEAYDYGEAQDWIGFILCPSAVAQLDEVRLPAGERLNYAYSEVPFRKRPACSVSRLPACILGRWVCPDGENPCMAKLRQMQQKAVDGCVARKYENAINFVESNRRWVVQEGQPDASPGPGTAGAAPVSYPFEC